MYICINLVPFASLLITCLAGRIYDGEMTKAEYFPHHLTVKKKAIHHFWIFVIRSKFRSYDRKQKDCPQVESRQHRGGHVRRIPHFHKVKYSFLHLSTCGEAYRSRHGKCCCCWSDYFYFAFLTYTQKSCKKLLKNRWGKGKLFSKGV